MTDSKMKSQSLQKWFSVLLLIALIVVLGVLRTPSPRAFVADTSKT